MKKIIKLLAFCGALMSLNAQQQATIQGAFEPGTTRVQLKPITMRPLPSYFEGSVEGDGKCTLTVDAPFSFICEMALSKDGRKSKAAYIYIRPGEVLQVDFRDKKPTFEGEFAKENGNVDVLVKRLLYTVDTPHSSLDSLASFRDGFEKEVNALDVAADLKSLLKHMADYETTGVKLRKLKNEAPEKHRELVKLLFEQQITSTDFLSANLWPDKLNEWCAEFEEQGLLAPEPRFEARVKWIQDPTVRSRYAVYLINNAVNQMKWATDPVQPLIDGLTPSITEPKSKEELVRVLNRLTQLEADFSKLMVGKPAPPFTFEDVNGNKVSLDDFKGKFVILDVWNIYCGPCIKQIPVIKGMEKELEERNVVFVSISSDPQDIKDKWKALVKAKEMAGCQLIMDNGRQSKFMTDYSIKGFPTFCVINPDGKVEDPFFDRPEDPAFKPKLFKIIENYRSKTPK
jgi:thiol-disulfide isomerase/thioredoxin